MKQISVRFSWWFLKQIPEKKHFREHPSRTKIKHFFYTNLLHLKFTWADSASRGGPAKFGTENYISNVHWKLCGYCAWDLSRLCGGWCTHTVQLKGRRRSVRAWPEGSAAAPAPNGAPAPGCPRLAPHDSRWALALCGPGVGSRTPSYALQR